MSKGYETGLFIGGRLIHAQSGNTFEVRNPVNDEVVARMPIAEHADIEAAVSVATKAQPEWSRRSAGSRAAVVRKFADLMAANAEKLGELDRVCMGKPTIFSKGEVETACSLTNFVAGQVEQAYGQTSLNAPGHLNFSLRQPFGVVAAIIPWNFPTAIFCHEVPAACGAGNAIIMKTSEKSPLSGVLLAQLALQAGFPPGIVNVVSGAGQTGELLSSHMKIRKISFTGSLRAGRAVMQAAARSNLKVVNLELGGKSPLLVFEDADLERAVTKATLSITFNSGQMCTASSRVYVHSAIAADFKKLIVEKFQQLRLGDPASEETVLGPQADRHQADVVAEYVSKGRFEGAGVLVGGERSSIGKNYIMPTILTDVSATDTVNVEEIFGPVLVMHEFTTEQQAIELANGAEFGLYASVFSENIDTALRVGKALEAGNVGVNTTSPFDSFELPFGGYKMSGIGRSKGSNAVLAWMEEKSVYIELKQAPSQKI